MRSLASTLTAAGLSCGCAPAGASLGCSGGQSTASAKGWIDSLTIQVIPAIGELPLDSVTTSDVLKIVSPLWASKPTTARDITQRLAQVFDYALEAGHITLSPCNGALRTALPRRRPAVKHHAALLHAELPGLIRAVRAHRVPLSTSALAVLEKALTHGPGLVFPSDRRRGRAYGGLSAHAFPYLLREAGYGHVTPHGFRATFRTWAMERPSTPWAVYEAALAHRFGGGEVAAYARSVLLEPRRALMQMWADFALGA